MDTCARIRSGRERDGVGRPARGGSRRAGKMLTAVALAAFASGPWLNQPVRAQEKTDPDWVVPRTPSGHPDLQGNWSNATVTPIQRQEGMGPTFTWEQVQLIESGVMTAREAAAADSDPNRGPPAVGGEWTGDPLFDAASGGTGGYNAFFIDSGDKIAVFNWEPRTSLVVDPENGQLPPLTDEAREWFAERRRNRGEMGAFDNPENRPLAERCIMSFGSNAGPPMLPNYFYNNNYTIVQTPEHIMILTEMVHDVRIIRMGEPMPTADGVRPWFGESWGRWAGDTLVVRTTNLNPDQMAAYVYLFGPGSENMTVTERFTRADEHTIHYEFTVEDPDTFVESWGGEVPFTRLDGQLYEYACHEGNYALSNVLSGARAQER